MSSPLRRLRAARRFNSKTHRGPAFRGRSIGDVLAMAGRPEGPRVLSMPSPKVCNRASTPLNEAGLGLHHPRPFEARTLSAAKPSASSSPAELGRVSRPGAGPLYNPRPRRPPALPLRPTSARLLLRPPDRLADRGNTIVPSSRHNLDVIKTARLVIDPRPPKGRRLGGRVRPGAGNAPRPSAPDAREATPAPSSRPFLLGPTIE